MAVMLYTDLPTEECIRRLSASGWAGEVKPHRRQPTATDPNILRTVTGSEFQLWPRSWQSVAGQRHSFPRNFYGRVRPCGRGTLITGYYGTSRRLQLGILLGSVLGFLALTIADALSDLRFGGADEWARLTLTTALCAAVVGGLYLAMDRLTTTRAAEQEGQFADHLAAALEARPARAGTDEDAREWHSHAALPAWSSRAAIGVLVALAIASVLWVIQARRAEDDYRARAPRLANAPRCEVSPGVACRASDSGEIARRYWRNRGRQWLLVRLPDGERRVAFAYTRNDRRRDEPDRDLPFQPGTTVTAERWEGGIVALTAGGSTLRTITHPEEQLRRNAADRRFGTIAAIAFAVLAGLTRSLPWLQARPRASRNRGAAPG